jgi:hypothetical protein
LLSNGSTCAAYAWKLEKELQEKKKEMGKIIEISNKAYEARDRAVNEMAKLKAQADKEQQAFEAEWRELGKLIEHDRKMKVGLYKLPHSLKAPGFNSRNVISWFM